MMRHLLLLFKAILRKICAVFFCAFPIDTKTVVFDNFNGGGFGCNPKYIAQALKNSGLKLIWLANDPCSDKFPSYVTPIKYDSLRAWYFLETAKVFVSNVRNSKGVVKRIGQKYLQTWHASLGPKMIEKDAEDSLSSAYIKQAKRNGRETDLMFANNSLMEEIYSNSFWYKGDIIRCGVPRNEPLIKTSPELCREIRQRLGIPQNAFICLFAPTWRNIGMEIPMFNVDKCLLAIESAFQIDDVVFCVRLHPNTDRNAFYFSDKIIDVSNYPDTQELLSVVDMLISDYSSILEDFLFTFNPAFMYAPDFDDYIKDRHFYYDLNKRPYPLCKSEEELFSAIKSCSCNDMNNKICEFQKYVGIQDDGKGALVIAEIVNSWTNVKP